MDAKNGLKRVLSCLMVVLMAITSVPLAGIVGVDLSGMSLMKAEAIDSRVEKAVQTAVAIANDNSHGYSQSRRQGPDYDCSSLVYYAFSSAGFSLSPAWFNTRNMGTALKNAGFTEITNINLSNSGSLQRGDFFGNLDTRKFMPDQTSWLVLILIMDILKQATKTVKKFP